MTTFQKFSRKRSKMSTRKPAIGGTSCGVSLLQENKLAVYDNSKLFRYDSFDRF